MLKVFEAFAGYGSQRMALRNLGIEHEVVAISEIDKFSIASYKAIHGETNNLGDISKINVADVPEHDLFTYSFPCQDISVAGNQKGFERKSGTRSGLLWECERIISSVKPKYLLMENVKNLVSKKFKPGFQEWVAYLESLGYSNYWEVLNAKNFGIPQNRERVFMVSILEEHEPYVFPKPIKLEKRLRDVLEIEVDDKYYLDNERSRQLIATITDENKIKKSTVVDATTASPKVKEIMNTITARYDSGIQHNYKSIGGAVIEPYVAACRGRGKNNDQQLEANKTGTSNALTTVKKDNYVLEGIPIKNNTAKGYLIANDGDGVDLAYPTSNTRRGRVQKDKSQTLTTDDSKGVIDKFSIRKLTPLECFRLMDVSDEDFYKAQSVNSNSQLYKQAGNSIVVSVLEAIFNNMFLEVSDRDLIGEHIPLF